MTTISKRNLGVVNFDSFFFQNKSVNENSCIPLNFPFFMLLIGPPQCGKTIWIEKFIACFSKINKKILKKSFISMHLTISKFLPICWKNWKKQQENKPRHSQHIFYQNKQTRNHHFNNRKQP